MNKRKLKLLVLAKLGDVHTKDVPEQLLVSYKSGAKYLHELVAEGFLRKKGKGIYEITDKGTSEIERRHLKGTIVLWGVDNG